MKEGWLKILKPVTLEITIFAKKSEFWVEDHLKDVRAKIFYTTDFFPLLMLRSDNCQVMNATKCKKIIEVSGFF